MRTLGARLLAVVALSVSVILGAGAVLQRCQLGEERSARATCQQRAQQLKQETGAAQAQLATYRAAVKEQNRQVELLRAETEELQERAEAAEQRICETRVEYRDRVRQVLMAPVPSDCEAAVRWAAQQAPAAARNWREGR